VSNRTIHQDLNIPSISTLSSHHYNNFHINTFNHPNPLISKLSSGTIPGNPLRCLKRKWPRDLLNNFYSSTLCIKLPQP
ncbi:zinc finger MYM-type protein 6-like, partial [Aphis craccivora]